jgi:hypothetical protein
MGNKTVLKRYSGDCNSLGAELLWILDCPDCAIDAMPFTKKSSAEVHRFLHD